MEYYLYNSQNDELTKLALDSKDKVQYTVDLKEAVRPEITKFVNTGDGQYSYDPYRFQELLANEFENENYYCVAVPKNYMKNMILIITRNLQKRIVSFHVILPLNWIIQDIMNIQLKGDIQPSVNMFQA